MDNTSLGDRMKMQEGVYRQYLTCRMPVVCRIDGRSFHSLTKKWKCNRPFDSQLMYAMVNAAKTLAEDMQGFKVAYIQSDEASFVMTDYDGLHSQGWFDYNHSKIVSISASIMTGEFNCYFRHKSGNAQFDSRAFNVPKEDVANYFLFRSQDWYRNSIQMYASSVFSHKQLHKKNQNDMKEMLREKGRSWEDDLCNMVKNGTFLFRDKEAPNGVSMKCDIRPSYKEISELVEPLINPQDKEQETKPL